MIEYNHLRTIEQEKHLHYYMYRADMTVMYQFTRGIDIHTDYTLVLHIRQIYTLSTRCVLHIRQIYTTNPCCVLHIRQAPHTWSAGRVLLSSLPVKPR